MPTIKLIEFDGTEHRLEADSGASLMSAVTDNGVPGLDADCGGSGVCGTCHVFVGEPWVGSLPAPSLEEEGMLATRPDRQDGSRLSCQLMISDELDGLEVSLPELQM